MLCKFSGVVLLSLSAVATSANAQGNKATLLECRETGGLTPKGAYFVKMKIRQDGSASFENNSGKRAAKLSKTDIALLQREIDHADYAALTATPSNKMSPAAYDGTETTYIFYDKGQRQEIAPYKYNVPPKTTLFKTVETLRKRYKL